ncbi:unnamed protein product [Urochloa humidicola]
MYAEGRVDGVPGIVDARQEVECTEAVKQCYRELKARKAKQDAAARKAKQDTASSLNKPQLQIISSQREVLVGNGHQALAW